MKLNKPTCFPTHSLVDLISLLFCRGPKRKACWCELQLLLILIIKQMLWNNFKNVMLPSQLTAYINSNSGQMTCFIHWRYTILVRVKIMVYQFIVNRMYKKRKKIIANKVMIVGNTCTTIQTLKSKYIIPYILTCNIMHDVKL